MFYKFNKFIYQTIVAKKHIEQILIIIGVCLILNTIDTIIIVKQSDVIMIDIFGINDSVGLHKSCNCNKQNNCKPQPIDNQMLFVLLVSLIVVSCASIIITKNVT